MFEENLDFSTFISLFDNAIFEQEILNMVGL